MHRFLRSTACIYFQDASKWFQFSFHARFSNYKYYYNNNRKTILPTLLLFFPVKDARSVFHIEAQLREEQEEASRRETGSETGGSWSRKDDVSAELLREHVSEVLSDRVPGGQGRPIEGFHLLSRGLLQVRYMRDQADPEDLLQQPAHDQR